MSKGAEIVAYLRKHGHTVTYSRNRAIIEPELDGKLREKIRPFEDEIVDHLYAQLPHASKHHFVMWTGAEGGMELVRTHGVCIACGIPWGMHGEPPTYLWRLVDDPDTVQRIESQPDPRLSVRGAA